MPSGTARRFGGLPPVHHPARPRVAGLGVESRPNDIPEHPPEGPTPEFDRAGNAGWSGIRGRSRFIAPPKVAIVGHGETVYPGHFEVQTDPSDGRNNQTRSPVRVEHSDWDAVAKQYHPTGLGDDDLPMMKHGRNPDQRVGILGYINEVFAKVLSPGRRVPDLLRWSDAGPIPQAYRRRIALNRQMLGTEPAFFTFDHTSKEMPRPGSTYPKTMTPGYVNRLTVRTPPRSFGAQTEVLS